MIDPDRIAELRRLMEAATPGPWYRPSDSGVPSEKYDHRIYGSDCRGVCKPTSGVGKQKRDTDLIVAMREILPALLATAETAQRVAGEIDRLTEGRIDPMSYFDDQWIQPRTMLGWAADLRGQTQGGRGMRSIDSIINEIATEVRDETAANEPLTERMARHIRDLEDSNAALRDQLVAKERELESWQTLCEEMRLQDAQHVEDAQQGDKKPTCSEVRRSMGADSFPGIPMTDEPFDEWKVRQQQGEAVDVPPDEEEHQ